MCTFVLPSSIAVPGLCFIGLNPEFLQFLLGVELLIGHLDKPFVWIIKMLLMKIVGSSNLV